MNKNIKAEKRTLLLSAKSKILYGGKKSKNGMIFFILNRKRKYFSTFYAIVLLINNRGINLISYKKKSDFFIPITTYKYCCRPWT